VRAVVAEAKPNRVIVLSVSRIPRRCRCGPASSAILSLLLAYRSICLHVQEFQGISGLA